MSSPVEHAGVVPVGTLQLVLAAGLMGVAGVCSLSLSLGLTRQLAVATARTYAQLLLLGLVLRWVFAHQSGWLVLALLLLMIGVATRIVVQRLPKAPAGSTLPAGVAMAVSGLTISFAVTGLVVGVEPWYRAEYVIPIAGMVIGNSMTGVALALERLFADLDSRAEEQRALVALGATPWEAASPSVRRSLRAGLIPTLNSMAAVGIVFIPGMMTGQLLGGADALAAARYQIVVMLMVSAATTLGAMIAVLWCYRLRFDRDGTYLEESRR